MRALDKYEKRIYSQSVCFLLLLYMCKKLRLQKKKSSIWFIFLYLHKLWNSQGISYFNKHCTIVFIDRSTTYLGNWNATLDLLVKTSNERGTEISSTHFWKIKCPQLHCVRPKLFDTPQMMCGSAHQRCSISLLFHVHTPLDFRSPLKLNSNY